MIKEMIGKITEGSDLSIEESIAVMKEIMEGKDTKVYSEKELNNAWSKVRTLNSQGKYDDAEKLEAELTVAYMEGRVK